MAQKLKYFKIRSSNSLVLSSIMNRYQIKVLTYYYLENELLIKIVELFTLCRDKNVFKNLDGRAFVSTGYYYCYTGKRVGWQKSDGNE